MKIYHWIIACCLLLPLGGCSNWLDVIPEDSVDEKDLFSTGEGYRNALNGVYRQMSQTSMYGQQMSWGFIDVLGQLYNTQKLSNYSAYGIAGKNYAYRDETVKSVIQVIWSNTYNSIANCNNIVVLDTGKEKMNLEIEGVKFFKQFVILKFKGLDNINDIEKYRQKSLYVTRKNAVRLQRDEYFIADLIGLKVQDEDGKELGTVKDVIETGANDVYEVEMADGKSLLLPAIKQCILNVDVENGTMQVHVLEGLLDL